MTSLAGKRGWKKPKYGNTPVEIDGLRFDSKGEAAHWQTLKLRQVAGEISDLKRQVTFRLEVNGQHVCRFIADYSYEENGGLVVEDFKSPATAAESTFRLKMKLMRACLGIDVRVVTK